MWIAITLLSLYIPKESLSLKGNLEIRIEENKDSNVSFHFDRETVAAKGSRVPGTCEAVRAGRWGSQRGGT